MKTIIAVFVFAASCFAQGLGQVNSSFPPNFGYVVPPSATVAQMNAINSPAPGMLVLVTDGAATLDCTVGGGSTYTLCRRVGGAWKAAPSFDDGVTFTVTKQGITDAQLATGVVLVPAATGRTVRIVGAKIQPIGGNAATCTDIRIENDSFANEELKFLVSGTLVASTWYDEASPVTQVTSVGNAVSPFGTAFAANVGIGIQSTGSTCATMTSLNVIIQYTYN